ncbi:MAG: zinc metallopeptidase [Clostridia bacterium]
MELFYGLDIYYLILVIPTLILSIWAQANVSRTFRKYSGIKNERGYSGHHTARAILDAEGLHDVTVERVEGNLSDHYDPRKRVVRLSQTVHDSHSLAALGVAAHETGHALQHKEGYGPLKLRSVLVPVAKIGSMFGPYAAIFGLIFGIEQLVYAGIVLFGGAVLFYLVTLPVELNASSRALELLERRDILARNEIIPAKKVLRAAAMTYIAAALAAVANLVRLILLSRNRR